MAKKTIVSPKGSAVYPHLNTPDTKFKDEGEFHTKLKCAIDDPKAVETRKAIDALAQATLAETQKAETDVKKRKGIKLCANMPYEVDDDEGTITFSFKMKASGKDPKTNESWSRKLPLFDGALKPLDAAKAKVGGGSVLKVSYTPEGFFTKLLGAGVTLRMAGVQVIELREWSRDGASMGFEAENEGIEESDEGTAAFSADDEEAAVADDSVSGDDF